MEVGEVSKGIRWSTEAGGPPKVIIGGARTRDWGRHSEWPFGRFQILELKCEIFRAMRAVCDSVCVDCLGALYHNLFNKLCFGK